MRTSIKPIFIIFLNMAVCATLGLMWFFLITAFVLLIARFRKFPGLWLIPAFFLVAIRFPLDNFIVGVGASVMLMQLWALLRVESSGYLSSLGAVTWFASLPAGPIHRNSELIAEARFQWPNGPETYLLLAQGFLKCGMGLFLSQHLREVQGLIITGAASTVFALALISILLFFCQLSGMTDLAIGLSRFFGVKLPENFDSPWKLKDLADFWRRWHISLNQWFFHEIYLPLAMYFQNRFPTAGSWLTSGILIFTTVLIGLWHGLNSVLLFWGLLNGALIILFTIFKGNVARVASWVAVLFLFLIMRLDDPLFLRTLIAKVFTFSWVDLHRTGPTFVVFMVGCALIYILHSDWKIKIKMWPVFVFGYCVLGFLLGHSDGHILYPGF